jgi:hypothetical protein
MRLVFFITLSMSLIYIASYGQLTKNTWLVGGSGSLYSYNEDFTSTNTNFTAKYTSIDITAGVGYFVIEKLASGLRPYLSSFKGESLGGGRNDNIKLAIGPFLRYYFLKPDKLFNILGDVSYQFGINNDKASNDRGKFNIFSFMGGVEAFFNSSVGIEVLVGYSQKNITIENSLSSLNSSKKGFQTSIGFQFHLEKK